MLMLLRASRPAVWTCTSKRSRKGLLPSGKALLWVSPPQPPLLPEQHQHSAYSGLHSAAAWQVETEEKVWG